MVRSPYVVYADCPLSRAYRFFVDDGPAAFGGGLARGQPWRRRDAGGPGVLFALTALFCNIFLAAG